MILPIAHLPARVLRRPVKPVAFPLKKPQLRLIKDMAKAVKYANGVGLAAPQVSKSLDLAVIYLEDVAGMAGLPIINPVIVESSRETAEMEEGCLSMPGVFGMVSRPKKITITAQDIGGKKFTITDDTFLARVLQHEIDHLNNILIIDKFSKITKGKELLPKYQP
jgi:peptide deformylase